VVVSGAATGAAPDMDQLTTVESLSHLPTFLGSGVSIDNVATMLGTAQGAIVGTAIKVDGISTNPVDAAAAAFVAAAR